MEEALFCPNCGTKVLEGEAFCGECGLNVKRFLVEQGKHVVNENSSEADDKESSTEKFERSFEPNVDKDFDASMVKNDTSKDFSKKYSNNPDPGIAVQSTAAPNAVIPQQKSKNTLIIVTLLLMLLLIGGGYYFGSTHYSRDNQVTALKEAITSGTTSKMKDSLIDPEGKALSTSQIDALKRLYLSSPDAVKSIEKEISGNGNKEVFSVTTTGKIFGLFDKYKVQVTPKILFIDTNIENPAFYINGKSIAATKTAGEYRIADLTPGVYDLKIKGSTDSKSEQVKITPIRKDDTTQLLVKEKVQDDDPTSDYLSESSLDESRPNVTTDRTTAPEPARKSSASSSNSMYGTYRGSPDLTLNPDGTYTLGSKSGTYSMTQNGSSVSITYYQNGGGSITETYDYDGSELYSDKYSQGWIKD